MDYKELLEQYGGEYCSEHNPDNEAFDMGELIPIVFGEDATPEEVFEKALFAYGWSPNGKKTEPFRYYNDEYFAFDGYAHLCSIPEIFLASWYNHCITESDFIEWLIDSGYIEDESEITYDEEIY